MLFSSAFRCKKQGTLACFFEWVTLFSRLNGVPMIAMLTNPPIKQFSESLFYSTKLIVFSYVSSGKRKSQKI